MKIKISQYTPIKLEVTFIIPKVSILTRKITLEDIAEIYLVSNSIHVMRKDTSLEVVPEIEVAPTRKKTKEDIMLTLQRMMNLKGRESKKKVNILQAMNCMF